MGQEQKCGGGKTCFFEISILPYTSSQCRKNKHTTIRTVKLGSKEVYMYSV